MRVHACGIDVGKNVFHPIRDGSVVANRQRAHRVSLVRVPQPRSRLKDSAQCNAIIDC
jgi:hypothetical protein